MMIVAILIFAFCTWAVLGKHFDDGIVAKHLLSLASILAFLVILDAHNYKAGVTSFICLVVGVLYAHFRPTRRRTHLRDRRERARPF
jgi:hypothetical protein